MVRKFYFTAIISFLAICSFLIASFAISTNMAKSGYLERVITAKNVGAYSMETAKIYWENDRLRVENYTVGGLRVQIKNGRTMFLYHPTQKIAIKTTIPEKYAKSVQEMLSEQTVAPKGGKKIGTAKVAGIDCDVYSFSEQKNGTTGKLYMSKDPRLPIPLKEVVTIGNAVRTVETRAIRLNYNVPDSMFVLPKGVKVKEEKFPEPTNRR